MNFVLENLVFVKCKAFFIPKPIKKDANTYNGYFDF